MYLHHNFVVGLLNDLFGIQARGGCSCAGPYGHRLLGIDLDHQPPVRGGRRGWVRRHQARLGPGQLQLLHTRKRNSEFILDAVHLVANEGWKLLPQYLFDPVTGVWRHTAGVPEPPMSLADLSYSDGTARSTARRPGEPLTRLADYLEAARRAVNGSVPVSCPTVELSDQVERLRWFLLPAEVSQA